jgi:hypothetical protein
MVVGDVVTRGLDNLQRMLAREVAKRAANAALLVIFWGQNAVSSCLKYRGHDVLTADSHGRYAGVVEEDHCGFRGRGADEASRVLCPYVRRISTSPRSPPCLR